MKDYSHPFIMINHVLRNYHEACNAQHYEKAHEFALEIQKISKELVKIAKDLSNAN